MFSFKEKLQAALENKTPEQMRERVVSSRKRFSERVQEEIAHESEPEESQQEPQNQQEHQAEPPKPQQKTPQQMLEDPHQIIDPPVEEPPPPQAATAVTPSPKDPASSGT